MGMMAGMVEAISKKGLDGNQKGEALYTLRMTLNG